YHVMCRGDHREAIFRDDQDRESFMEALGEMCARCGTVIHSYVLIGNHYHLLIETPRANLVDGMKWFQGTYTARFNARHRLRGHLFSGRYKGVVIEGDEPAYGRMVSDYIHLNPVRAGIVCPEKPRLRDYGWSSFPALCGQGKLPSWLAAAEVLSWHHLDWRRSAERRRYERYLQKRAQEAWTESGNRQEAAELAELRQGWALGSQVFRERMSDIVDALMLQRKRASYAGEELRRHDETAAQRLLDSGLHALGMELPDARQLRQNDRRKQALAWLVKTQTIVGDEWVRQQLDMGDRSNVSRAVSAFRKGTQPQIRRLKRHLHVCTD
ncbi:MAG TPA: transposase, partial [Terrimicrobiaceae bacterium]